MVSWLNRIALTCCLALSLGSMGAAVAADVTVRASVSDTNVRAGGRFEYVVALTISGGQQMNMPPLALPDFAPFREINQRLSDSNRIISSPGRTIFEQTRTVVVELQAPSNESGTFTIPAASAAGTVSQPVSIEVVADNERLPPAVVRGNYPFPFTQPRDTATDEYLRGKLYLYAELDRDEVYIREPVQLTWHLYELESLTTRIRGPIFQQDPCGAISEEAFAALNCDKLSLHNERVNLDGQSYVHYWTTPVPIIPKKSGDLEIPKFYVQFEAPTNRMMLFAGSTRIVVPGDPLRLKVKPLPGGAPSDFSGAVGTFKFEASVDREAAEQGVDYVNLSAKVTGPSFMDYVGAPALPSLDDFKVYEELHAVDSTVASSAKGEIVGTKQWDTVLVPERAGPREIGPLKFSYFDPKLEEYVTLQSDPLTVQVSLSEAYEKARSARAAGDETGAAKAAKPVNEDYAFIARAAWEAVRPTPPAHPPRWTTGMLGGLGGLFLLSFLVRAPGTGSEDARRRSRALNRALAALIGAAKAPNVRERCFRTDEAVRAYLADKTLRSADGLTSLLARELVEEHCGDAALATRVERLLDETAGAAYLPSSEDPTRLAEEARSLLLALESAWKGTRT